RVGPRGAAVLAHQDEAALADGDGARLLVLRGVDRLDGAAAERIDDGGHDLAAAQAGQAIPRADEGGGVGVGEGGGVPAGAAWAGHRLPGPAAVLGHEDAARVLIAAVADDVADFRIDEVDEVQTRHEVEPLGLPAFTAVVGVEQDAAAAGAE